jgi:hypothetical protein
MKNLRRKTGGERRSAERRNTCAVSAPASVAVDQHHGDREDNYEKNDIGQVELHESFPAPGRDHRAVIIMKSKFRVAH